MSWQACFTLAAGGSTSGSCRLMISDIGLFVITPLECSGHDGEELDVSTAAYNAKRQRPAVRHARLTPKYAPAGLGGGA